MTMKIDRVTQWWILVFLMFLVGCLYMSYREIEDYEMILPMKDDRIQSLMDQVEDLKGEVNWYVLHTKDILGPSFRPGNVYSTSVTLSSYNPVKEQCDNTPLISSDNKLVTPGIVALPKHYREDLNISLGQIVVIPPYGQFLVRDHMNNRKPKGRVDIISFIPGWSKKFGKVENVTMYWFPRD